MDYLDIGFSNIRLLSDENSYIYRYDRRVNTFPEEVFVHEFLHTMERVSRENGLSYPFLHDYAKYGYENKALEGLKQWYADFMTKQISYQGEYIGLDPQVYTKKPIHTDNFTHTVTIEFENNPQNILEEINTIFKVFTQTVSNLQRQNETN